MGKKYLETKKDSLESSVLEVWKTAIEEGDDRMDGRTKQYREHRKKLESARVRRVNKEEVELKEKPADFIRLSFNSPADVKKAKKWMEQNLPGANQGFTGMDASGKDIEFEGVDDAEDLMDKLKKAGFRFKMDYREEVELEEINSLTDEELDQITDEEIDLFELDDEMFEDVMKKKSAGDRKAAAKKKAKWAKTSGGKKSALKSKKRSDKVRKGTVKVDKSKSKVAKKRAKIYAGDDVELDEGKMKELHGYIEAGKSAEWIAKKMGVDVKTIKSLMSGYNEEVNLDEASGDKEAYQKFFNAALKKFKVSSPAELEGDQKKKFYDYIDANWEADNEKAEAAMSQVREFKIQSMKAALAQIWGMEEGKNPFKKEDDDDDDDDEEENKKKVKTETGKKPAAIDLKPKIDDR
jgi:hypothetical protein